ncbi:MAG: hypothetical protein GY786_22445 [Proteobacteria bacterium]|nr:hypothetical protein [Pseudomonadota bacterium]
MYDEPYDQRNFIDSLTKQGFLRNEVLKSMYRFLDCGLPENEVARIQCDDCVHDYFVAFSCRYHVICPSCSTKRSSNPFRIYISPSPFPRY